MKKEATDNVTQQLLPLPYEEITELPNRDTIRSHKGKGYLKQGKQNYEITHERLQVRAEFNARKNIENLPFSEFLEKTLKISELATQMLASGYPPPAIKGDFTPDANNFIITDGHRRYYAIAYLLANGHTHWPGTNTEINMVEIEPLPKEFTELDRAKLVIHSQNNLQLTPLEYGHQFVRLNRVFGMSHDEIALEFNGQKSRQWVTNMIALADLPESVQKQINSGHLTATAALALKTNIKDEKKLEETVQASVESGNPITVKQAQQAGQELQEADYSDYQARINNIIGDCRADINNCVTAIPKINEIRDRAITTQDHEEVNHFCLSATKMVLDIQSGIKDDDHNVEEEEDEDDDAIEDVVENNTHRAQTNIEGSYRVETDEADEKAEQSGITSAKAPTVVPKDQKDALPEIDFSHEKEEGIMDLTESIGMADKISARLENIPMPVQHKKDLQGLCEAIVKRSMKARDILTLAADKR